MRKRIIILASIAVGIMAACGGGGSDEPYIPEKPEVPDKPDGPDDPDGPDNPDKPVEKHPVKLTFVRSEGGFQAESRVGLYMVNYRGNDPVALKGNGNFLDNTSFTYHQNKWTSSQTYYWAEDVQQADFFAYYPYTTVADATNCPIQVNANQQSDEHFTQSDILWGKAVGKSSDASVRLTMDHLMSKLVIQLKLDESVTVEELKKASIQLNLCNLKTQATLHLGSGKITLGKEAEAIVPHRLDDLQYVAFVIPQEVKDTELVSLQINEDSFSKTDSMKFESGKQHTVIVKVSKKKGGLDVGIEGWDENGEDYGGEVN